MRLPADLLTKMRPMSSARNASFSDELPRLLAERGMSMRALARTAGVSHSHLSRVVGRKDYKTPSLELMRRVAFALGVPAEYFPEYRELAVVQRVRSDPTLRDKLYDELFEAPG